MTSGVSLTSLGEGASLALASHPSSDAVATKIPLGGRRFITSTSLAPHVFLLNLILLSDQLRLA